MPMQAAPTTPQPRAVPPQSLLPRRAWWRWLLAAAPAVAAFAYAAVFWHHLVAGAWLSWSPADYARSLGTPLEEAFLAPLNVLRQPWMILVHGLLLGTLVTVPLLVAIAHRLGVALALAAAVAVLAHCPVLAVAVVAGCFLAARTPLRSSAPFLAMLLGLVPAALYLYFAAVLGSTGESVLPIQRWALRAPLLLTAVTAVLAAAVVLAATKAAGFRLWVFYGMLALLPVAPVGLFYTQIGPAELEYRLIAADLHGEELFVPRPLGEWKRLADAEGLTGPALRNHAEEDLQQKRRRLIERCMGFLTEHPDSGRAAELAWVRAQARSLELDERAYRAGVIRYTASGSSDASEDDWAAVVNRYPASAQAAVGRWHLGRLAVCHGELARGEEALHQAVGALEARAAAGQGPQPTARVLPPPQALPSDAYYAVAAFRARRLLWLIRENRALEDPNAAAALADWCRLNPLAADEQAYARQLERLAKRHAETPLAANFRLALAKARGDLPERIRRIASLAEQQTDFDAKVEATYELGQLAIQAAGTPAAEGLAPPAEYFRRVSLARSNPWDRLSRRHLESFQAVSAGGGS